MPTLYEKVYGCLAASRVASAMGAPVEGWSPERIKETHGYVDKYHSYLHYADRGVTWQRMPGTTEDGIERQKLMCRAIIAKGDRITCEDLCKTSAEATDLDKAWYMTQPEDLQVIQYMKAGVPAVEIGKLTTWHATNFARACHPLGLINAGDPEGAVRDVKDIGRLYFVPLDVALTWAGVYVAAIAEACKPGATVDSVIETAVSFAPNLIKREINRALDIAGKFSNYEDMRAEFYKYYNGIGVHYSMSQANETVSKCLAVFKFAKGDPKQATLDAVNFGRDTDCLGATAAGLAGALNGIGQIPTEWVEQLDAATMANPYTNAQVTIKEHADGMYGAIKSRVKKMRQQIEVLES